MYLAVQSFYVTKFFSEAFAGLWYGLLLVFGMNIRYLLSPNSKNTYFYREFLWKQTFLIG